MLRLAGLAIAGLLALQAQPKLSAVDESSYPKLIASHKGKVVLVDFWATWRKPCRAEMPQVVALESRLRSRGFQLLTVSADEPEQEASAVKFINEIRVPAPAYIRRAKDDDKFASAVDPKWSGALPALFLYDRAGRKVKMFVGETPIKDLEAAILRLL